jgi:hypothetical protein
LIKIAQGVDANLVVRHEFLAAIRHHPEILAWA